MSDENRQAEPIIVDEIPYNWQISESDVVTDITIRRTDAEGQSLRVGFNYPSSTRKQATETEFSPDLLKKIIRYALKKGWEPMEFGLVDFFIYGEEVDP